MNTDNNLTSKLCWAIMLCLGILTGCDVLNGREDIINTPSMRLHKIDMTGVHGFAIAENTSDTPSTKADNDGGLCGVCMFSL